jgi:hypothetical protein
MKHRVLGTLLIAALLATPALAGMTVGPGGPNYGSLYGILSDHQQSYGQVSAAELNLAATSRITSLTVWGVYYNYSNFTNNPPVLDNFTFRLHNVTAGDPDESFFYEQNLGAGVRTDTGQLFDGQNTPLTVFKYEFTGLDITAPAGLSLMSLIDDTTNPTVDGYWHWVTANDDGTMWWRREDNQPAGQEDTFFWTSYAGGDLAYEMTVSPIPTPGAAVLGVIGLALATRMRRA